MMSASLWMTYLDGAAEVMTLSEVQPEGIQDDISFLMNDVLGRALGRRQGRRGDDTK